MNSLFSTFQQSFDLSLRPRVLGTAEALTITTQTPVSSVGRPVRLKIPAINLDSAVEYVGLTPEGNMDVPDGPDVVAWYERGQRPGEKGSAVISGHYDWKNNVPAVFENLQALRIGDKLSVEDDTGATTTFVVRGFRTYGRDEDAATVFGSSDEEAHLNLITCTGTWDTTHQSYSHRLIVFTDREDEHDHF